MDHPGIAKVLRAGETSGGDPFFAIFGLLVKASRSMISAMPAALSIQGNVFDFFVSVCRAVQHAHQKGVIHRDIKPSNILVTEVDGKPQPKIIDFGIAKALGLKLTEKTMVTLIGTPIGTAVYMSPEQAGSSGVDVDTRTDIYSLGVLLYLLLVGRLPRPSRKPRGCPRSSTGLHRATRIHRDRAFRFNELADYRAKRSHQLGATTAEHLTRSPSGDLDWIVMKALRAAARPGGTIQRRHWLLTSKDFSTSASYRAPRRRRVTAFENSFDGTGQQLRPRAWR